jgi:hypothetical protein
VSALDWLRRKNAEGVVLLLARSADPAETLRSHIRQIDDAVVDALVGVSYQQTDDGQLENALRWAELAEEACLAGQHRRMPALAYAAALFCGTSRKPCRKKEISARC